MSWYKQANNEVIFRKIKDILDPDHIVNPGKLYIDTWKGGDT